jgi:hypothetical protein
MDMMKEIERNSSDEWYDEDIKERKGEKREREGSKDKSNKEGGEGEGKVEEIEKKKDIENDSSDDEWCSIGSHGSMNG